MGEPSVMGLMYHNNSTFSLCDMFYVQNFVVSPVICACLSAVICWQFKQIKQASLHSMCRSNFMAIRGIFCSF